MTHLHPDTDFLTDYAAGSLADSHALCVAAHLEHCPNCASEVEKLTSVGGAMFSTLAIQSSDASQTEEFRIDDALIEETLEKAVGSENQTSADNVQNTQLPASAAPVTDSHAGLPVAFRTLAPGGLENLAWKTFGKNLSVADIDKIDDKREVAVFLTVTASTIRAILLSRNRANSINPLPLKTRLVSACRLPTHLCDLPEC